MSASTANVTPQQNSTPSRRGPFGLWTWLITIGTAVAAPIVIWILTDLVGGHRLMALAGSGTIRVESSWIGLAAAISASFGLGLKSILNRFAKNPRKVWLILAPIALLLSLMGPLGGTTGLTIVVLLAMHLMVGGITIAGGLALSTKR